jgi:hypothetical protein
VRDPLDPLNPYRGQYADYDAWIYAHAWQQAQSGGMAGDGDDYYSLRVDADGWPEPMRITQKRDLCDDGSSPKPHCYNEIQAWGVMDQPMQDGMMQDAEAVRALNLPRIPQWLAQQPPDQAMLLPGGEVVTQGPLGNSDSEWPQADPAGGRFYRFSATGQELGRTAAGAEWWTLYFKDFAALQKRYQDSYWNDSLGCIMRIEAGSGEVRQVYDYHGARLPGDHPPAGRAPRDYTWLGRDELVQLYWQQNGGVQRSV